MANRTFLTDNALPTDTSYTKLGIKQGCFRGHSMTVFLILLGFGRPVPPNQYPGSGFNTKAHYVRKEVIGIIPQASNTLSPKGFL